jgi:uncharacterized membrane protein
VSETLARSARVVFAGSATYASGMLLVRMVSTLQGNASIGASPGWDVVVPVVSLAVAYLMWTLDKAPGARD